MISSSLEFPEQSEEKKKKTFSWDVLSAQVFAPRVWLGRIPTRLSTDGSSWQTTLLVKQNLFISTISFLSIRVRRNLLTLSLAVSQFFFFFFLACPRLHIYSWSSLVYLYVVTLAWLTDTFFSADEFLVGGSHCWRVMSFFGKKIFLWEKD